jgi:hypothetical protein
MKGSSDSQAMAASPRIMPRFKGMQGPGIRVPRSPLAKTQLASPGAEYSCEAQQRGGTMYLPVSQIGPG